MDNVVHTSGLLLFLGIGLVLVACSPSTELGNEDGGGGAFGAAGWGAPDGTGPNQGDSAGRLCCIDASIDDGDTAGGPGTGGAGRGGDLGHSTTDCAADESGGTVGVADAAGGTTGAGGAEERGGSSTNMGGAAGGGGGAGSDNNGGAWTGGSNGGGASASGGDNGGRGGDDGGSGAAAGGDDGGGGAAVGGSDNDGSATAGGGNGGSGTAAGGGGSAAAAGGDDNDGSAAAAGGDDGGSGSDTGDGGSPICLIPGLTYDLQFEGSFRSETQIWPDEPGAICRVSSSDSVAASGKISTDGTRIQFELNYDFVYFRGGPVPMSGGSFEPDIPVIATQSGFGASCGNCRCFSEVRFTPYFRDTGVYTLNVDCTAGTVTIDGWCASELHVECPSHFRDKVGAFSGVASFPTGVHSCAVPPNPENGLVSAPTLTPGSVATYTCLSGYALSGSPTRTCKVDGTWSGDAARCVPG